MTINEPSKRLRTLLAAGLTAGLTAGAMLLGATAVVAAPAGVAIAAGGSATPPTDPPGKSSDPKANAPGQVKKDGPGGPPG